MSDYEFIPPPKTPTILFAVEPVYNALCSLNLLNSDLSGFSEWVQRTAAALSPEQLNTNRIVGAAAADYLEGATWPSFPAWLDDMARRDPHEMRERALASLVTGAERKLGADAGGLPTPAQLLADRGTYLSLMERVYQHKGMPCDLPCHESEHELLQDPVARQDLILSHLRGMWDEYLAQEWERSLPMIRESAAAWDSIDFAGKSTAEIVRQVIMRDRLPDEWHTLLPELQRVIFIPSAHIGPYLLLMDLTETTTRIVLGARVPEGATAVSPALSRSELLMRLSALADDTRLRILELLAEEGELSAQEIISRLGISQSGASRHLRQLSATGYLSERRHEGAKRYRLNPDRLDGTLGDLKRFLG
jgi:DNA-binding transcriptional ArsR family regulator